MDVKILVAAYKEVDLHKSNIYLPVQVRTELNNTVKEYQMDNEGDDISTDSYYFSELTILYWAWKKIY